MTWILAPALILGGGIWGAFGKVESRLTLRLGERVPCCTGGLQVALESLREAPVQPGYQLLASAGKGTEALEVTEGLKGSLPGGYAFEVERLLPDALDRGEVRDTPDAPENPALRVMLGVGAPQPLVGLLFANHQEDNRVDEPGGRFAVVLREAWHPDLSAALRPGPPASEIIRMGYRGRTFDRPASPGSSWDFLALRFQVVGAFPDFMVRPDAQGRPQPASRSDQPYDPWVELAVGPMGQTRRRVLLSALDPIRTDALNAPNLPEGSTLRYLRPGEERQSRFVVMTWADRQVRLVEQGRVRKTEPLVLNRPFIVEPGLSVTPLQEFSRAEIRHDFVPHPGPRSEGARPALRLKLRGPGQEQTIWLDGRDRGPLSQTAFGGRLRLGFQPRELQPADLKPELVLRTWRGKELARQTLEQGTAMTYRGHALRLTFDLPAEPDAIAVHHVKHPGTEPLYLGCVLFLLGLSWQLLGRGRKG